MSSSEIRRRIRTARKHGNSSEVRALGRELSKVGRKSSDG
jgi:hypothetical protein